MRLIDTIKWNLSLKNREISEPRVMVTMLLVALAGGAALIALVMLMTWNVWLGLLIILYGCYRLIMFVAYGQPDKEKK